MQAAAAPATRRPRTGRDKGTGTDGQGHEHAKHAVGSGLHGGHCALGALPPLAGLPPTCLPTPDRDAAGAPGRVVADGRRRPDAAALWVARIGHGPPSGA